MDRLGGRHREYLERALVPRQPRPPLLLGPDHRQRRRQALGRLRARDDHEAVVVAHDRVAGRDPDTAEDDCLVHGAAPHRRRPARRTPAAEHREIRPGGERADVAHGAVHDDPGPPFRRAAPDSGSPIMAASVRPPSATTITSPAPAAVIA
jgi:hypothetical protein